MAWTPTFWNFYINGDRVEGSALSDMRATIIDGPGSDPKILLDHIDLLLLGSPEDPETERNMNPDFKFHGKRVQVVKGKLLVNGKPKPLKRQSGFDEDGHWVRVRDVVKALGGTYRYDAKLDRAYMRF
jgi:hypothetical protein